MADRLVRRVPTATFDVMPLSDAAFDSGVASAGYQDPGATLGTEFVDGLGVSAPPLILVVDGRASEPMTFEGGVAGGHPAMQKVTYIYSDGEQEQRTLPGALDAHHTFALPGRYTFQAINDFGQRSNVVVRTAPHAIVAQQGVPQQQPMPPLPVAAAPVPAAEPEARGDA